jgi:holo-[acyl-carrier protein] synthase
VTLTDDPPMAQAFVIIEALPLPAAHAEPATARVAAPDRMV